MKLARPVTFLAVCGLTTAARIPHVQRWDYDVCQKDCSLNGVAMPDQNNFRLPLESFWSEQCPPIVAGDPKAPVAVSKACLTFSGAALQFTFAPFSGYNFMSASVTWKVMGKPGTPTPTPCRAGPGGSRICSLQFADILGISRSTNITDLMAGMCPHGDREGLDLYLQLSGNLTRKAVSSPVQFVQQFPCKTRAADRSCTAWDTSCDHIQVAYRCTDCNNPCHSTTCTPSTITVTTTTTTASPTTTTKTETTTSPTTTTETTTSDTTTTKTETTTTPTTTTETITTPTTTTETTTSPTTIVETITTPTTTTETTISLTTTTEKTTTTETAISRETTTIVTSTTTTETVTTPTTTTETTTSPTTIVETITTPTTTTETTTTTTTTTSSASCTVQTCSFGTAFGYQPPEGTTQKSFPLNTQSGNGCNRWGWFEKPTLADLQGGGISGFLYVGAGGNDISHAFLVGTWTATATAQGLVTVTYHLSDPPYTLADVHVDLVCTPPPLDCAPGQYTFNSGPLPPNTSDFSTPPLLYPICPAGSEAALIVHASVNVATTATTCPGPVAT